MIPAEAKPSGTAELVKFKLEGTPPKHFPWTDHEPLGFSGERGLVIAIQTPRAGSSGAGGQTASTLRAGETWVYSPGDGAPFYSEPFEWLGLTRRVRPYIQFVKKHLVWPIVRPLERIPIRRFHGLMEKIREKIGPEYHVRVTPGPEVVKRLKAEVRQVRDLCATLDRFNADLRKPKVAKKIQKRLENIEGKKAPGFDDQENQWLLRLSRIREGAAEVSSSLRPWVDWALLLVFVLLGSSALFFHFYAHLGEEEERIGPLLILSTILLLITTILVVVFRLLRWESRRLDSRALAEALRVRRVWSMAGIGKSVADSYVSQLRGEISWVRQALLHVCPPPRVWEKQFDRLDSEGCKEKRLRLLEKVREEWIKGQIVQFHDAQHGAHRNAKSYRNWGVGLAVVGWVALAAIWLIPLFTVMPEWFERYVGTPSAPNAYYITVSSALVIAGGLCIAYSERCAFEDLAKQYERMKIVFRNGDREFRVRFDNQDIEGARNVITKLGEEAIIEHSQWLILRRARPLEVHIGA